MLRQTGGTILRVEEGQQQGTLCATAEDKLQTRSPRSAVHGRSPQKSPSPPASGLSTGATTRAQPGPAPPNCPDAADDAGSDLMEDEDEVEAFCNGLAADLPDSDTFSEIGESGGTEVVYVREGVAIWPSKSERIMGRLSLVKQQCVMFLAWLPYSHGTLRKDGTFHVKPCGTTGGAGGAAGGGGPPPAAAAARSRREQRSGGGVTGIDRLPGKGRTMYAVHPFPLSDVKAVRRHTPTLGWHYIVVVLVNGVTLPPLYFHKGGIKELVSVLKQHVTLVKCMSQHDTLLVNDTSDPLQRSLTSLDLTDVLQGAPPSGASATFQLPMPPPGLEAAAQSWTWASESSVPSGGAANSGGNGGGGSGPAGDAPWKQLSASIGDALSKIVQNAGMIANSTSHWLFNAGEMTPLDDGYEGEAEEPRCDEAHPNGGIASAGSAGSGNASSPSAATANASAPSLAARSVSPPRPQPAEARDGVAAAALGGVEVAVAPLAVPAGNLAATAATAGPETFTLADGDGSCGEFEMVDECSDEALRLGRRRLQPPPPLAEDEWESMFDAEGRLLSASTFRERIFTSGVEAPLRREAWKYLLGLNPPLSTAAERLKLVARRATEYEALRKQWMSISNSQVARFAKWRERRSQVEKDVRRTDRALPFYAQERGPNTLALRRVLLTGIMWNFDLGYCQGMSDLASPLLLVMRDEAEAFWAFAALMDRMEGQFSSDQQGMHAQLHALGKLVQLLDPQLHSFLERQGALNYFFCFRWLLILFKREFRFEETLRLWECLWSCPTTPHLHLYLCVAVLVHHRRAIMEQELDFDGLLKYCVELSGRLDLASLLRLAETLCAYAGDAGRECVKDLPKLLW